MSNSNATKQEAGRVADQAGEIKHAYNPALFPKSSDKDDKSDKNDKSDKSVEQNKKLNKKGKDALIIAPINAQFIAIHGQYFSTGGVLVEIAMTNNLIHNLYSNNDAVGMYIALIDYLLLKSYLFRVERIVELPRVRPQLELSPLLAVNTLEQIHMYANKLKKGWGVQRFWTIQQQGVKSLLDSRIPFIMPPRFVPLWEDSPTDKPGYVYFMYEPDRNRTKIGFSVDPWRRLKTAQTTNSNIILLDTVWFDNPRKLEAFLHDAFGEVHYEREFFTMSREDVLRLSAHMNGTDSVVPPKK